MANEGLLTTLWTLGDVCRVHADRIARSLGLTRAEFSGLLCLEERRPVTCRDMSGRMGLSVSRGSRVIEGLYAKGCISREYGKEDRRCKHIELTERGGDLRKRALAGLRACEERINTSISAGRIEFLKREMERLIASLTSE